MPSLILNRTWRFRNPKDSLIGDLSRGLRIPKSIAAFLVNRGLTTKDAISDHLTVSLSRLNDPFLMKDMDRAMDCLVPHILSRDRIGIFGDYDADGVTASSLLYLFFRQIGLDAKVYLPHRERDGYGLNTGGIDELLGLGCKLMVTCDCGITNLEEVAYAREKGLDVIVTDHHEPLKELPNANAVINPKRADCPYPFKDLAGVGVAFCFVMALRKRLREHGFFVSKEPNLKRYLDLVAIGTVSDMMPLFGDNRIMVRAGLDVLERGGRPGLDSLMERAGLKGGIKGGISSRDIAFRIGPRLNAAGRMDSAKVAFDLLVCQDEKKAQGLSRTLESYNQERQRVEGELFERVLSEIEDLGDRFSYCLFGDDWPKGILGLVASKVQKRLLRPVILLTRDEEGLVGSGRCPDGLDLFSALCQCQGLLERFGGHKVAAGLRVKEENFPTFQERFEQVMKGEILERGIRNSLELDWEVDLSELTSPQYVDFLELLEPFGPGYEGPLFFSRDFLVRDTRLVGERHLKLSIMPNGGSLCGHLELLAWGLAEKADLFWDGLELAFTPEVNSWQGRKSVQLVLKDAREKS